MVDRFYEVAGGKPQNAYQTVNQTAWTDATAIATPSSGKRLAVVGVLASPSVAGGSISVGFWTSGATPSKYIAYKVAWPIATAGATGPVYIDLSACPVVGTADHVIKAVYESQQGTVNVYYYEI
jgi:hypothetical protein